MAYSGLEIVKAVGWEVPADFTCRIAEFAKYLDVNAAYDRRERMGRMYWAMHDERIVGYMMLAMGHVGRERQADLDMDTHGQVPALAITRLAVDKRHERNGVGRYMVSHAVDLAGKMALDAGCRLVLADSEPCAVGFYEKMGFTRFDTGPSLRAGGLGIPSPAQHGTRGECEGGALVTMYVDLGRDKF